MSSSSASSTTEAPTRSGTRPTLTRWLHRHFWSGPLRSPGETVRFQRSAYDQATLLVRVFYAVSFLWIVGEMGRWGDLLDVTAINELWPARWIDWVGFHQGIKIILAALLVSGLAVLAWPERVVTRLLFALSFLQYMALINSPTKINHNFHAWLYCALIFVLLPDGRWRERQNLRERHWFLTVFGLAQFAVLFAYTLTGVWKVWEATVAALDGKISGFHLNGFSYIVADRLLRVDTNTIMGPYFARNAFLGWLLFVGTMYLETVSVVIAFRPRLHKLWGFGLLAFHLGTQIVMGFTFNQNIILVSLLFILSPFRPEQFVLKDVFLDIPGIHIVAKHLGRRRRAPA